MTKTNLSLIKAALEKIARKAKVKPQEITNVQFRKFKDDSVSERQIRNLGGFTVVKNKLFGSPADVEHPMESAVVNKATDAAVGKHLSELIKLCAEEKGIFPHEVSFAEFQTWSKFAYGKNCKGIALHNITRAGGFAAVRDKYFPPKATPNTVQKLLNQEEARANRKALRQEAVQKLMMDELEKYAERVFKDSIKPIKTPPQSKGEIKRTLNVILSDLHFGSDLTAKESRFDYGPLEEARRLASIVKQVCEYKPEHRAETSLNVLLLGDVIENQLHDLRTGAPIAEQTARAIHLLGQALAHFASHFAKVDVYATTGNHDRSTHRHNGRAVEGKYDSFGTIIYVALKNRCRELKNVKFSIPRTPYVFFDLPGGKKGLGLHGDGILSTGNLNKSINVGSLENQINKINSALPKSEEFSVVAMGHVHKGTVSILDNGEALITNLALVPVGPYAISLGIFSSVCGQTLFESVEGFPVGDIRFMRVDTNTDKDASLDSVISKWIEFDE